MSLVELQSDLLLMPFWRAVARLLPAILAKEGWDRWTIIVRPKTFAEELAADDPHNKRLSAGRLRDFEESVWKVEKCRETRRCVVAISIPDDPVPESEWRWSNYDEPIHVDAETMAWLVVDALFSDEGGD